MPFDAYRRDLSLALRNVVRQKRRSLFALATISGGVIALIISGGFIQWIFDNMRESTIHSHLGHVQVVRPDFFEKGIANPYAYLLPKNDPLQSQLEGMPGVITVTPRLVFSGLISHDESSIGFSGEGVDPARETDLSRNVHIVSGEPLSTTAPNGIIVGEGLAANLGIKTGDTVVLLAATRQGGLNAVECQVRGLFMTATKAYDDAFLRAPLPIAQQLARSVGATSWVVLLNRTENTDTFIAKAREAGRADIQFVAWHELADFYKKTVTLMSKQIDSVKLMIALIIVLSISNTLTAAVIERTGEIGTIMAIGLRRRDVLRMFIIEGLVLGVIGGVLGVILGSLIASVVSYVGIPMPPPPGMAHGFTGHINVTPLISTEAFALAVVTTLLASILPAWKASKMVIVDALRHQR